MALGFIVGGGADAIAYATVGFVGTLLAAVILTVLAWVNRYAGHQWQ